jgi:hypothetical protein
VLLDGESDTGVDDIILLLDHTRIVRDIAVEVQRLGRLRTFTLTPKERGA